MRLTALLLPLPLLLALFFLCLPSASAEHLQMLPSPISLRAIHLTCGAAHELPLGAEAPLSSAPILLDAHLAFKAVGESAIFIAFSSAPAANSSFDLSATSIVRLLSTLLILPGAIMNHSRLISSQASAPAVEGHATVIANASNQSLLARVSCSGGVSDPSLSLWIRTSCRHRNRGGHC